MSHPVKIKNALISVYYKDNLEPLIRQLNDLGVTFYSTGGTEKFIRDLGIDVIAVEDLTGYPSILGGRVKTLHPKVFGGILSRRELKEDKAQTEQYEIPEIDLVIVDLYPFEETLKKALSPGEPARAGSDGGLVQRTPSEGEADIIEKIDIGGISLIRAAAKNYDDVVIIASKNDYKTLGDILTENGGYTMLAHRKAFARQAFNVSSHYDSAIFNYFNQEDPLTVFKYSEQKSNILRYGENPHQKGFFYGNLDAMFDKLNGKELSYNNLVDIDAAVALIDEFEETTFVILKHTNACGVASRESILEAWKIALSCDPVSAFGGVLICNREIDAETAAEISKLFFEVLIAPSFTEESLQILSGKKNRILLKRNNVQLPAKQFKTLLNGVIEQDKDLSMETPAEMHSVTDRKPGEQELKDLVFANKIVKHTKSNTVVLAKDARLIASGMGQTSRVDALQQAIVKAKAFNFELEGSVMASDAFFPFPDCVEIAAKAGVGMILQPGGSIKDQESIDMANDKGVGMVTTGIRHFKH